MQLIAKVTRAVQYAHSQGILHRDLKPGNVLLDGRGEPLVSDFGLAKWLDATSDLTRTLTVFGTPGYIAPEQAQGPAKNLTAAADIYSIGAVLFDLFTGQPPFLGEHALAVIKQAAEKPAPQLRTLAPSADRDLETICARCLEREPHARYRSAGDLAEDLERWLEGRPIIARPVSSAVRVWRWSKRNPMLAGSIATCLLLGAIVGASQFETRLVARAAAMAMHSVAVEPLLDLDTAQPDSKLSGLIAVTLQNELSHRGPARVILASTDTLPLAYGDNTLEAMKAHWGGARTALQGTKRVRDGKLRVSVRLINATDGKVLYRRIVEAAVPDQSAETLAELTGANIYAILHVGDLSSVESVEEDPGWLDQGTKELLVAGKAVEDRRTLSDLGRAIELFQRAANAEPRSALAFSRLAEAQAVRAFLTGELKYLSAAEESASTAINLNPRIAATHRARAFVQIQQGRFRESLDETFTAYELADVNDAPTPARVADNLRMIGQSARAVAWYRLLLRTESRPGASEHMLGDCLADLADDEQAAAAYRRAASLFPEQPDGWIGLCRLALLQRNFAAARQISSENWTRYREFVFSEEMAAQVEFFSRNFAEAERLYQELASKDLNGGGSFFGAMSYPSAIGRLRLAANDQRAATRILEAALNKELESLRSAPHHPEILYRAAAIESSLGKIDDALSHLRQASADGWIDYRSLDLDPRFDALRSNARYQEIFGSIVTRVTSLRAATSPAEVTQK